MVNNIVEQYTEENPEAEHNLTPSEYRGYRKLLKRIANHEIIVYQTDKSGKLAVTTPESYKQQGDVHVKGDQKVDWETINKSQRVIRGHMRGLNRIFKVGENQGQGQERVWEALELKATVIPDVAFTPKDHKPMSGNLPKTRPIT